MNIGFDRAEFRLDEHQVIRLVDPRGTRVECLGGALWITQEHDRDDHLLQANDSFTLDRPGLALIHARAHSRIVLVEPAPPPPIGQRLMRAVVGWLAQTFGPESIGLKRDRGWHFGL